MLGAAISHNLPALLRFGGRTPRALYWPWAVAMLGLAMVAWAAVFLPTFLGTFARLQAFAAAHPDQATLMQGPGTYSVSIHGNHPELMPDFPGLMRDLAVIMAVFVALIAAATVRRLHDAGRSVWWAVPPLVLGAVGLIAMQRLMGEVVPGGTGSLDLPLFGALFLNNAVYLLTAVLLLWQLVQPSAAGERRS